MVGRLQAQIGKGVLKSQLRGKGDRWRLSCYSHALEAPHPHAKPADHTCTSQDTEGLPKLFGPHLAATTSSTQREEKVGC